MRKHPNGSADQRASTKYHHLDVQKFAKNNPATQLIRVTPKPHTKALQMALKNTLIEWLILGNILI